MLARPRDPSRSVAFWAAFAVAAAVFVVDAMVTIAVVAVQPGAVEQNPIARWALEVHPSAPYVLKAAIVAECAAVAAALRAMGEGWAAAGVVAMMTLAGALGIATAIGVLTA